MTDSQIKVAHVTTADLGLRFLLLNQLRDLKEVGYEVIGVSSEGPFVPFLRDHGIRHIAVEMRRHPFTPLHDARALLALYRVFRRERPMIVHTHNPKPGLLAQVAARAARVPVIVNTIHGFYFHSGMNPWLRRHYVRVERAAARCSHVILSQNDEDISTAIAERICPPSKIRRLGNGIDLVTFNPDRYRGIRRAVRARFGIKSDALVVGFVGRLVREKGILELLDAARAVCRAVRSAEFLIVGPVDYEKRDVVIPAANDGKLHFVGLQEDMPAMYSAMDVFALPSYREGFPRAAMEASAMGLPVIASDIRGCREVVLNGVNGYLIPPRDTRALADTVIEVLRDSDLRMRLGEGGMRRAGLHFDEQAVFRIVKEEYARLLAAIDIQAPLESALTRPPH